MNTGKKVIACICTLLIAGSVNGVGLKPFMKFPTVMTANAATPLDISSGNITITDSGEYIITGSTTQNKIVVQGGSPTITLQDVTIDLSSSGGCPLDIQSGTCNLYIEGTNTISGGYDNPGIRVKLGTELIIDSVSGELNATGGHSSAGIGGGIMEDSGEITINGGTITATGTYDGSAGIGGGGTNGDYNEKGGTIGTITINGGVVNAYGASSGAGIGAGLRAPYGGTIIINGGDVHAQGGNYGAGIGSANRNSVQKVIINGGNITAQGGRYAQPVGNSKQTDGQPQTVTEYNGGIVNGKKYYTAYTISIPATVQLGSTAKIKAENVSLSPKDEKIEVKLSGTSAEDNAFKLATTDGVSLEYTVTSGNTPVNVGDTVLSIDHDQIDQENSVDLVFNEPESVIYSGEYSGTVIFNISVKKPDNS